MVSSETNPGGRSLDNLRAQVGEQAPRDNPAGLDGSIFVMACARWFYLPLRGVVIVEPVKGEVSGRRAFQPDGDFGGILQEIWNGIGGVG
jgi:hypothetical protein